MTILLLNKDDMFVIFEQNGAKMMTVVTGGVAQVNVTLTLSDSETQDLLEHNDKALRLARAIAANPPAFSERAVHPPIMP